ncbi:hypothetical protein CVT24_001098 [Panaeolus cyanescens]|uniref:Major facilitator superfamily (MFS) profile domain-containing protein n=1 Tax=Panaeolus cyanescens TaxID=181874 RepID=A0A409YTG3_9AGAR|nr:hypothetical protein CVT24_001098 [Panaeolus cyanescens]
MADSLDEAEVSRSPLQKQAILKLDTTILPILTLLYLLSLWIAGLQHDLGLTDHQYGVCVSIVYVTHMLSSMSPTLLLRKIGPQILLPAVLVVWGGVVISQGLVSSYAGLIAIRLLLGIFEGPMYPGIVLYLSVIYTRQSLSLRIATFVSSASLAGAFSGLLAATLVQLDGVGGRPVRPRHPSS